MSQRVSMRSCRCAGSKTCTCPPVSKHLDVRLIDQEGQNDHLDFVLLDTVRAIEQLRAEDRTVFVHCVQAHSRTPTIGALYGARKQGVDIDQALRDVRGGAAGRQPERRIPRGAAATAPEIRRCIVTRGSVAHAGDWVRQAGARTRLRGWPGRTGRPTRAGVSRASNLAQAVGRSG